jgi:hypothetical protein
MNVAEFVQLLLLVHDGCERAINYLHSSTHDYRTPVQLELSKLTALMLADSLIESNHLIVQLQDDSAFIDRYADDDYSTMRAHCRQIKWRMESALWCLRGLESLTSTKAVAYLVTQIHNNANAASILIDVPETQEQSAFERAFEQLKNMNPGDLHL